MKDNQERSMPILRRMWAFGGLAILMAAIYWGVVVFSRWRENKGFEEAAALKKATLERTEARQSVEALGGTEFQILSFYATPGAIHRGETAHLCYGVSNAVKVRIEPGHEEAWPSYGRCVDIAPTRDTTYTLTAEDAKGNTKLARVFVVVRPPLRSK